MFDIFHISVEFQIYGTYSINLVKNHNILDFLQTMLLQVLSSHLEDQARCSWNSCAWQKNHSNDFHFNPNIHLLLEIIAIY
jgi:hypothetical protein